MTKEDFSLLDENGFTPAQAAELKKRVSDVNNGIVEKHSLIENVIEKILLFCF